MLSASGRAGSGKGGAASGTRMERTMGHLLSQRSPAVELVGGGPTPARLGRPRQVSGFGSPKEVLPRQGEAVPDGPAGAELQGPGLFGELQGLAPAANLGGPDGGGGPRFRP